MAEVTKLFIKELSTFTKKFYKDPRVQHLPMVGSPIPVIGVITLYVLFAKKWGPSFMSDRKPVNVKFLIRLHNLMQILLNGYAFCIGIWSSYLFNDINLTCGNVDYNNLSPNLKRLLQVSYLYYVTKYLDLFDTVFFVLRKKNNHVSFLHVYHHSVMVIAVWIYMTFYFGGHPTMLGIINSFVHTIMYSYYFVSLLDIKVDLKPLKKRITQIQIFQFIYLVIHFSMPIFNNWCNLEFNGIHFVAVIQNIFMTCMFLDFYFKTYVKKSETNQKKIT